MQQVMQQSVVTLTSIADLPSHLRAGDLLMLDIDETLVMPEADATEAWFYQFTSVLQAHGVKKDVSFRSGVELWQAMQAVCDASAPEFGATRSALAAAVAIPGVEICGLTARGPEVHAETVDQLIKCGVYEFFATNSSLGVLEADDGSRGRHFAPLTHLGGVTYCSGSRKPAGLRAFEAAAAVPPGRRVVLVDDRQAHCQALCDDRQSRGQPFLGLHYVRGGSAAAQAAHPTALPRGWQLFGRVLALRTAGRQRMRNLLDMLDEGDDDSEEAAGGVSGREGRRAAASLGLAAVFGAGVGAAACWALLRGQRRS